MSDEKKDEKKEAVKEERAAELRPLFDLSTETGRKHLAEKLRWSGGIVKVFHTLTPEQALAMDPELGKATKALHEATLAIKARLLEIGIEEG